jgi:hypothetical protein
MLRRTALILSLILLQEKGIANVFCVVVSMWTNRLPRRECFSEIKIHLLLFCSVYDEPMYNL